MVPVNYRKPHIFPSPNQPGIWLCCRDLGTSKFLKRAMRLDLRTLKGHKITVDDMAFQSERFHRGQTPLAAYIARREWQIVYTQKVRKSMEPAITMPDPQPPVFEDNIRKRIARWFRF